MPYSSNGELPFSQSDPVLGLSHKDVAEAIEFWLNSNVLKHPCSVIGLKPDNQNFISFTVRLKSVNRVKIEEIEETEEMEDNEK